MEEIMKTRTIALFVVISLIAILLSACNGSTVATVSADSGLSKASKLAVGILKLEDTSEAVTASEAGELLTLWEAYQSLINSDATSQVELDALVKQIEGTMTSQQVEAIDAMELTEQLVSEAVQSVAGSIDSSMPASTPDASTMSQQGPQDGGPGGMPGGDSVMSEINGGMSAQSTPEVTQAASNTANTQVDPMLLNGLIQLLKTRSQTSG
jgi:hypothetical protein